MLLTLILYTCVALVVTIPAIKTGIDYVKEKIKENYEVSIQATENNGSFFKATKWYLKGHKLPTFNHSIEISPLHPDHSLFREIGKIFIPKNKFKLKTKYGTIYIEPLIASGGELYGFVLSKNKKYKNIFKNIITEIHTISNLEKPYEDLDLTEDKIINKDIEWKLKKEEVRIFNKILGITRREREEQLEQFLEYTERKEMEDEDTNVCETAVAPTLLLTDS